VYDKQIAQDVNASLQSLALGSVFEIVATAKPGHTAEELEAAIDAEIQKLATDGPTPAELAASQTSTYSGIVSSLERIGGFGGVADRINMYNQHTKDPAYLNQDLARYAAVTPTASSGSPRSSWRRTTARSCTACRRKKVVPPAPPTPPAPAKEEASIQSKEPGATRYPAPAPRRREAPDGEALPASRTV